MATQVAVIEDGHLPLTAEIRQALHLTNGTTVSVSVEQGRMIVEPITDNQGHAKQTVSDEDFDRMLDELQALFARKPGEPSLEDDLYRMRREEEERSRRKYGC